MSDEISKFDVVDVDIGFKKALESVSDDVLDALYIYAGGSSYTTSRQEKMIEISKQFVNRPTVIAIAESFEIMLGGGNITGKELSTGIAALMKLGKMEKLPDLSKLTDSPITGFMWKGSHGLHRRKL